MLFWDFVLVYSENNLGTVAASLFKKDVSCVAVAAASSRDDLNSPLEAAPSGRSIVEAVCVKYSD